MIERASVWIWVLIIIKLQYPGCHVMMCQTTQLHILIVEDHREIRDMLSRFLTEHGYKVAVAQNGRQASVMLRQNPYDLILMDLMLPYKSGEALITELRTFSDTPVICLSAKSQQETKLAILRMGADDYLLKPFDLDEVLVRMEVVLRRSRIPQENAAADACVIYQELCLYTDAHRVTYRGQDISLTAKEYQILQMLMQYPKKTFSKANLYESVWGQPYYYEDNTINVHVSNLRSKLKKVTGTEYIETVWGIGYRMREEQI